ncbi:beta-propeller fold lactonase family protein [Streptomyces sp. NPDC004111]|uniref:lactonase family protein n=1 Tax=Streptomyces sp. NPDC004111 TaxID=3364690 RepID=UPI0036CA2D87
MSRRGFGALAGAGAAALILPGSTACAAPAQAPGASAPATGADPAARSSRTGSAPAAPVSREAGSAPASRAAGPALRSAYLGTYTTNPGGGKGIGLASYRAGEGGLTSSGVLGGVANPSYLALSPDRRTLYAVNEQAEGAVTAVRIGDAGEPPRGLGSRGTGGADPCHVSVHPGGRFLLSANYTGGSVAVHPIGRDGAPGEVADVVRHTGSGPDPERQQGPHAHMVLPDPAGRYVLAVDLGTDSVYTYRLDERKGKLRECGRAATRPGAGPRHLAFHPSGKYAYLVNELDNTLVVCGYDARTGALEPGTPQATLPSGTELSERNYPAGVIVSADGRFVYVSNRGHNSIAHFAVQRGGAELRLLWVTQSGGAYPRHIVLDPAGTLLFAANQKSGAVTTFRIDRRTGRLTSAGAPLAVPVPVCVLPL